MSLGASHVGPLAIYIGFHHRPHCQSDLLGPSMTSTNTIEGNSDGKQHTYDVGTKPPSFGHALRAYWAFEPKFVNLNIGQSIR